LPEALGSPIITLVGEVTTVGPTRRESISVLIVDDDPLARRAIRDSFASEEDLEVCGEATSGSEGVELAKLTQPAIVVMDVTMPGLDGIAATRRILESVPDAKVVVFSATTDDELGLLALRAGAMGYLTKGIDLRVLPRVVRGVAAGEAAITRRLSAKLLQRFRLLADGAEGMRPVRSELTPREWEVLDLLCADASTEAIAGELELSIETVRSHIKHILRKLGVHSRAEAVLAADKIRRPRFAFPSTEDESVRTTA
jgi:DNA-binding NarL/FixJ family response regulator